MLSLNYALSLAQEFEAELHLIHVSEPPAYREFMSAAEQVQDMVHTDVFKETLEELVPAEARNWCSLQVAVLRGQAHEELVAYAVTENIDMIAMGVVTSSNDVWFSVWNGSSWGSTVLASSTATSSTALVTALAFESQSGDLLATYAESSNLVSYRTWTSGGGWSAEMSGPNIGASQTPNIMTLTADPASNQIMLGVQDSDSDCRRQAART